jgi:hypothetical protein
MEELKTMHTQLIEWAEFVVFVIALARFVGAELVRLLLDLRFFFRGRYRRRNRGTPRPKPRRMEQTSPTWKKRGRESFLDEEALEAIVSMLPRSRTKASS